MDSNLWQQYLDESPNYRRLLGQIELWNFMANVSPKPGQTELVQLPTGYGKTIAGLGSYLILRGRRLVNRLLVLVPTDIQREQWVRDAMTDLHIIGGKVSGSWKIEKLPKDFICNRDGSAEVFVASYQQLNDGHIRDLMSHGKWFLISDECHHLAQEGSWAKRQAALPVVLRLGLTATPLRSDREKLIGFPEKPIVKVSYREAVKEKAVRPVHGHIQSYHIEYERISISGPPEIIKVHSSDLRNCTSLDEYEARRQLRYHRGYLGRIAIDAIETLCLRRAADGHEHHQMIVFAMSCKHADYLTQEINTIAQARFQEHNLSAKWVGVGHGLDGHTKSDEENDTVVQEFKDKRLPILVQVDKAGEGFSVKTATVLLFLHLLHADAKIIQQVGRGTRRNEKLPWGRDWCDVFASSDTEIAEIVKTMEQQSQEDDDNDDDESSGPGGGKQPSLFDIPDLNLIDATYDRTDHVGVNQDEVAASRHGVTVEQYRAILQELQMGTPSAPHLGPQETGRTKQDRLKSISAQVAQNLKTATGNIIRVLKHLRIDVIDRKTGSSMENGKLAGHIKTRLNAYFKNQINGGHGHDSIVDEGVFSRKNTWLQQITSELKANRKEMPQWLKQVILN